MAPDRAIRVLIASRATTVSLLSATCTCPAATPSGALHVAGRQSDATAIMTTPNDE